MKTSTSQAPKQSEPKTILIVGPAGSGKTTLALQFPNLWIADCDRNLDGPERYLRKVKNFPLNYSYDTITIDDDGKPVATHDLYNRLMDKLLTVKAETKFDWIIIDSLTHINEFIIQKVYKEKGVTEMEARHWATFKSNAYNLLVGRIRSIGKNVIVVAHEVSIERAAGGKDVMTKVLAERRPYIQGGINEQLGGFFTDMWRMEGRPSPGGKVEYVLQTNKTQYDELKNSIGLPYEMVDPTYEKIRPYLEGTK